MANKIKVNKKMIVLVIVAVIVLNAILIGISIVKNKAVDKPNMEYIPNVKSFEYYCGGDEYGRSESYTLKEFEVKHSYDGGTTDEESIEESYDFLIGAYNDLDEIIDKYKVKQWTNLDKNPIEVLDASTTSVKIVFEDGTIINLGDAYQMPENGWLVIKEIIKLFKSNKESK